MEIIGPPSDIYRPYKNWQTEAYNNSQTLDTSKSSHKHSCGVTHYNIGAHGNTLVLALLGFVAINAVSLFFP